jgi:integrase
MAVVNSDKGRLFLDFMWQDVRCREYLDLDDTKEGRARAKQTKIQVEAEISKGTLDYAKWFPKSKKARTIFAPPPPPSPPPGPPTFATFAREFVEGRKGLVSNGYHADLTSLLDTHLIPFFGIERLVTDIHIEDVERFVVHLKSLPGINAPTMSSVRVNKARALLWKLLDRGLKKGWVTANPVDEVPRLRENPADIDPLSWQEVHTLLDKGFPNDPEMRRFYTVALFTGLRTSELIALKWTRINWTDQPPTAAIKHSYTKADGEHLTKTAGSARDVDLRPQVVRALKEQQAATKLKSDWVFCNALGGPLDRDNLMNRVWYPALKRAGLKERKPYQTRHSFATLALSAGEDIAWVAKQMGHKNSKMIIEHYYKWVPNNTRQDGAAFDQAAAKFGL